ncbi:MAG: MBL fold metallo-hydrolase [Myxococcota bacterium]|nr:MBL fold metallo-hydrolase [Myxococcota bacterium]
MAETHLHWRIGDVEVTRVEERIHGVPRDTLVPGITDAHLAEHAEWASPYFSRSGRMLVSVHSFVVRDVDRTLLVDTCSGVEPERPLPGDPAFLERLEKAIPGGAEAVDTVLCTHLHFDHVGWNTRVVDGTRVPTFPNARYLFARVELESLDEDDHAGVRSPAVAPLLEAGLVDLVETDAVLTPRIRLVPTPGHTPGHVSVAIESRGERGVITGDVLHTPLQVALPELTASPFDADPDAATRTRGRFLDAHADVDCLLLGTHFPPPTAGRVRTRGRGRYFAAEE